MQLLYRVGNTAVLSQPGTSIDVPTNREPSTNGGASRPSEACERLFTMSYTPNTLFPFVNTPNAVHGVEPVVQSKGCCDLLLYDIKVHGAPNSTAAAATA